MSWPATALAAAMVSMPLLAPADSTPSRIDEVEACLRTCDAQDDATDRATCRLQCETKVGAKDEPNIIRWRRTEEIRGGVGGQEKQRRETTTIEATTPRGPTPATTETRGPARPPSSSPPPSPPAPSPAVSRYLALASCQARCDGLRADRPRATCKLQCLHDPHGSHAPVAPPSSPKRTTERGATQRVPTAATTTSSTTPSERPAGEATATDVAACRRACSRDAERCRNGCSGRGSDRSTCDLQCDQVASRCHDGCE